MADFRLAASAEAQIDEILARSEEKFGELSRRRYALLLVTAMQELASEPTKPWVTWIDTSVGKVGVYHISHSRKHVADPPGFVRQPSHLLVFRITADNVVEILGVMHETMLRDRAIKRILRMNAQP